MIISDENKKSQEISGGFCISNNFYIDEVILQQPREQDFISILPRQHIDCFHLSRWIYDVILIF